MTDTNSKKSIMRMLDIQQLISQYQHHCQKMSNKKKNSNNNSIRNRYSSLLDFDTKKQHLNNQNYHINQSINKSSIHQQSFHKNNSHKNIQSKSHNIQSLKQNTIQLQTNYNKNHKVNSQNHKIISQNYKINSQNQSNKPKVASSLSNFTKKAIVYKQQKSKKISINQKQFHSQSIQVIPQNKIKTNKNNNKFASYLSLKARNNDKQNNSSKVQTKFEIDFDNPILAGINKKIKQFQTKGIKKQQNIDHKIFRKSTKPVQPDLYPIQKQIKTVRMTQTINQDSPNQKQKQFISIDTNYYGFSFKNKIPYKNCKSQLKKQNLQQVCSTLDKSSNEKQTIKINQKSNQQKQQNNSKLQQKNIKKTYNTLNIQKNDRYNSTNVLKRKQPHSSLALKPKQILKERYQLIKVIGRGMSGQVFQAKDILSDRYVAIKQIDQNCIEYNFFRQISHQNIIKYYNNFIQNKKRYLVLQYFPLTLKDLLKDNKKKIQVTQSDIKHIFKAIINGLSYLHSLSIAHRDIKLDNIVISQNLNEVKFIDFGLCIDLSTIQQGLSKQFCGTLSYLPPQIIQGLPHQPKKADIWSLGVVLYGISVGRLPYKGKNENQILSKICKAKPVYPQGFNPKLKQLIDLMLQKNPNKRFTVSQIMSHQWLH